MKYSRRKVAPGKTTEKIKGLTAQGCFITYMNIHPAEWGIELFPVIIATKPAPIDVPVHHSIAAEVDLLHSLRHGHQPFTVPSLLLSLTGCQHDFTVT